MAIYPGARWEPISGHTNGRMRSYRGVVLHCNDAESLDLHSFFQNSSGNGAVSSHFQVTKDGTVYQYLDTANTSWCQSAGNNDWLSIESEGLAGELATGAQINSIGLLIRWMHQVHGIPLTLANSPSQAGLGWHGMGAPSWGHAVCPGVRKDQRTQMLAVAQPPPPPPPPIPPVPLNTEDDENMAVAAIYNTPAEGIWIHYQNTGVYMHIPTMPDITALNNAGAVDAGPISEPMHQALIASSAALLS